ncbi:MAG: hypothetical protein HKP56_12055 [Anderseniella sp.]|nr:hypothetical protein [Anderseniella sp.]
MSNELENISTAANRLAELYDMEFGGKKSGRYRMPAKLMRELVQRKRLYEDDIQALGRALLERGFVLVDMDSFYVVVSANAFVNYRRANEDLL